MNVTESTNARVTLRQIADRVELSQATVSRVLNGKGHGFISESTRRRVFRVAEELGYRIRGGGSDAQQVRTLALWIRNPSAPYYAAMMRVMMESAATHHVELLARGFFDHGDWHASEPADARAAGQVDGVFAVDVRAAVEAHAISLGRQTPFVGMGSDYPLDRDYVAFDAEHGIREAVEHLLTRGCRRIVHLSAFCSIEHIRVRRGNLYAEAVREAGLEPVIVTAADESRAAARRAIADYVAQGGRPDGVFCINDDVAIGAYAGLREAGLRVPGDVALVGFDAIDDGEYLEAPLTSVRQPIDQLVAAAWDVMFERLRSPVSPPQQRVIRPWLVVRSSSDRAIKLDLSAAPRG